ncbi:MAG: hypothetical protein M1518_01590 [Candidatus Thermoplasmatota archaeon]|jgi:hypothetical protein|nr:hypothetical protein [Candidatus Thermoplasmatota archaeon]
MIHLDDELKNIPVSLCIRCKGSKLLCGKSACPIVAKAYLTQGISLEVNDVSGDSPPSIFVGQFGYPKVRIGPALPVRRGDTSIYERPDQWGRLTLDQIAKLRFSLYRGYKILPISSPSDPNNYLLELHDLILSSRPVFSEIEYSSTERKIDFSAESQPFGPGGYAKNFYHESSPSHPNLEKVYYDTDLKTVDALKLLYSETSIYAIEKVFSAGMLGKTKNRKIVPTRWSITAVDKTLSDQLIPFVRNCAEVEGNVYFHFKRIGNEYYILIVPGDYSFEMIELWNNGSIWAGPRESSAEGDYEKPGRMVVNPRIAGAFFAAKLPILDYLKKKEKKGNILVFRFVDGDYTIPLGVWQVRENVKIALRAENYLDSIDQFFDIIKIRRKVDLRANSKTYQIIKRQRKITEYVK